MRTLLNNELKELNKSIHLDNVILEEFSERINYPDPLYRDKNPESHLCTFYLPLDTIKKKIYLVVHKKSGLWMPPGGHLDLGESPTDAIKRECKEELNFTISHEPIKLFTVSIEDIDNPRQLCKKHFSFWYLVRMDMINFDYNREESTDGKWVSFAEAQKLVTFYSYVKPIASLSSYLEL